MTRHELLVASTALAFLLIFSSCISKPSLGDISPVQGQYTYLALGDSYSAGQDPYGVPVGRSYTDFIRDKLAYEGMLKKFDKEGVSGYRTTDVLHQLSLLEEKISNADIITIDVGINDILQIPEVTAYWEHPGSSDFEGPRDLAYEKIPVVKANIIKIINSIKEVNPKEDPLIYIMGYFNPFPHLPEFLPIIKALNTAIKEAADETGVPYVDSMAVIDEKLLEYLPGDIHPTVDGYEAIGEVFWERIMEDFTLNSFNEPADIQTHWAKTQIFQSLMKGIVRGYEDGTFRPDSPISRAEFITMINRFLQLTDSSSIDFSDVSEDTWYKDEIGKAVKAGYIMGFEDQTFRGEQPVTRQQTAVMIVKAMNLPLNTQDWEISKYQDEKRIPSWSREYLNTLVSRGILQGYPDGTIGYDGYLTRAAAVSILARMDEQ
jgi:lysophospholipase L1-like esterase